MLGFPAMPKRPTRDTPPKAQPPGLSFRKRLPKQLSGRVTQETFDQYEPLRDTLRTHNGDLFTRGVEALIHQLPKEDRRDFEVFLQRIRRQRGSLKQ